MKFLVVGIIIIAGLFLAKVFCDEMVKRELKLEEREVENESGNDGTKANG
jgi:hypothetical protein